MERKNFLKSLLIGAVSTPAVINACKKSSATDGEVGVTTTPTGGSSTGNCVVAPTETEGPFPTKSPASYVRSDITDGRSGHKMTAKITIGNSNNNCNPLAGAIVDIWHCDAEGNYSEYGGTGMQSTNYQSVHFLRGRQTTDSNGLVTFTSIFPGWYSGRATHIHVHVYNASGNSLKVTQIAKNLNISHSAVSQWLSGKTLPSMDKVIKMNELFICVNFKILFFFRLPSSLYFKL